ncbi:putative endoglucanase B [Glarea lozoyensis 74030]|uniref:Putative endoglucanase B n=1 Tax=Glarea lozoyensis (strain ATCC 74030 / MF5533) TaxID=1104152 RepID=H0EYI2_GLAL7|nr:putative endoglucanase B [Glarea lozoyensis 74030]
MSIEICGYVPPQVLQMHGTQMYKNELGTSSAAAAFAALDPGWNLGNTLDAVPNEGSWNNPPAQASTLAQVKARGFKSIRIPVTWAYHFTSDSPTWQVDKTFMDRVETVVDQALALDFSVVLNVHHDSWVWADPSVANANTTMIEEKFTRLWSQIASRFSCKSSKLIFEALNEPAGSTKEHADLLNRLNTYFLDAVNRAGGHNPNRVLSLSGLNMNTELTSLYFTRPTTYPLQPWGLQFHYYSPYDFVFGAWGKTIWGSDADKASLVNDFELFHGNFSHVPTFIGEWSVSTGQTETAARWKYTDFFVSTAKKYGYSSMQWDNGNDQLDRTTGKWRDEVGIDILLAAAAGKVNSLADSTEDGSATSQFSSAYYFHKLNTPIADAQIQYILNGNTLLSITDNSTPLTPADFSITPSGLLTLSASYLSPLATAQPGLHKTLTLTFSAGAPLTLSLYVYTTPTLPVTTYNLTSLPPGDLHIPISYAGLPQVAA